jgi:hypothetical protein
MDLWLHHEAQVHDGDRPMSLWEEAAIWWSVLSVQCSSHDR